MNILYIAPERRSAQAAASALHRFSQNVTLTWAQTPAAALGWLRDHRNAQAVIVDVETQNAVGNAFLEQVRKMGVTTPIAVIAPDHLERLLTGITASLDGIVEQERHAKGIVEARLNKICTTLQDRVLELEAANRTANESHLAQTAARKTLEQRLAAAEASRREADETHGAEIAALTARLRERDPQQDAALARTNRICTVLQERLLELEDDIRNAAERHAADAATSERLTLRESELAAAVERNATLERQLSEHTTARTLANERFAAAEIARQRAEARHAMRMASLNTDLADLKARHEVAVNQHAVTEGQLRDASAALDHARARIAELVATSERLSSREADLEAALTVATAATAAVEHQLTEALGSHERTLEEWESERRQTDASHTVAMEALTTRLAEIETKYDRAIETAASIERQLSAAEAAHQQAQQDWNAERTAAAEHLARRESELGSALAAEAAIRIAAERKLVDAEAAHQHARRQADAGHAQAVESLTSQLTGLRTQYDDALRHSASVERQLTDAGMAYERAQQQAAADLAAAAERHAALDDRLRAEREARTTVEGRVKAEIDARTSVEERLKTEVDARTAVESQLAAVARARQEADADHARTVASLTAQLTDLQTRYDGAVEHSAAIEAQLTDAVASHERAQHQATADLAAAAERYAALDDRLRAEREARTTVEEQLKAEVEVRTTVENQLAAAARARQEADADHARTAASLTAQLTDLQARYDDALEHTASIEARLTDAVAAHERAQHQATTDLSAAAERYAALDDRLRMESDARTTLEHRLAEAERAHQQADADHATAVEALSAQLSDLQSRYDGALDSSAMVERQLADTIAAHERARQQADANHAEVLESLTTRLADLVVQHDEAVEHGDSLERQLADANAAHERSQQRSESERAAAVEQLARREADLGAALAEEAAARVAVEHRLASAENAHQHAQWQAAADVAAAAKRHADLEDQLVQAAAMHAALEERLAAAQSDRLDADQRYAGELAALTTRFRGLQSQHDAAVTERDRDIAQLREEREGMRRQLTAMRTHVSSLRREAERVASLEVQLGESQKEIRRQFECAPYGLFECTPTGTIMRVNHVLARLLRYRSTADLPRRDFAENVFECAADLQWLLERAQRPDNVHWTETTLKTRDRRRLSVRLHALTSGRSILIAVEDLTKLSTLEQRVREAQRLEAVGRVASEVAVTCDTLLRDVTRGGQRWLAGFESDDSLRQQGELLLGDVTRAAGLLRQFADYGHTQITSVEPVSVQRVLDDMKPVLERVLGDAIQLTLPKPTRAVSGFDVDVEAPRIERILVNVANYARERMPQGGRVRIQLATTVVDQRFLASHPKVRPGAHVVITISEMQGAIRPTLPIQWPAADPREPRAPSIEKPGMDLGPLMALISDLGGHLWMSVEPAGNVTLQIHLPKRTQDEVMEPAPPRGLARGRQLAKWFRH